MIIKREVYGDKSIYEWVDEQLEALFREKYGEDSVSTYRPNKK